MSEPQPIIGRADSRDANAPDRDPTLRDTPEVLKDLTTAAQWKYYFGRVHDQLQGPHARAWLQWIEAPKHRSLFDAYAKALGGAHPRGAHPRAAFDVGTGAWWALNTELRGDAGLPRGEDLTDANFHDLMPDRKQKVLARLAAFRSSGNPSNKWAVETLLGQNPHLNMIMASSKPVEGSGPDATAEFSVLLNTVAYTKLSFRVRAQDRAKALVRLPGGGLSSLRPAEYKKLTIVQKRRLLAFFDEIESNPVNVPTLRISGQDLRVLGRKYLEKYPEIARGFETLRALKAFSAVLNVEGGFPSEDEFSGSVFKMVKPDRAAHVARLLSDIAAGEDSALVAAVNKRFPAVTRRQMTLATSYLLANHKAIARAVDQARGNGADLAANQPPTEPTYGAGRRFVAEVNRIARRDPGSAIADADLQSFDTDSAEAVLNFLGAVQVALHDGVVSQPVRRLYKSMGRTELQEAAKAFRRSTPETTVRVRAHMLTPDFQLLIKAATASDTKSVSRRPTDSAPPRGSESTWLVSVEKDVMKWASQEALDVTRLNEVSKQARTAGPHGVPGLRRVKPTIYDLRSAQGGDFRFVAVTAVSPERTLTFQAVYKHHRATGKQLHRGKAVPGY